MCKRNASAAGHGVANAVRLDDEGASAHRPREFLQPWAVVAKIDVALQGPLDLTTPALDDPSQAPMVVRADAEVSWGEAAKGRQCLDEAGSVESGVRALGQLHQLGQRIHAAQRVKVGEGPWSRHGQRSPALVRRELLGRERRDQRGRLGLQRTVVDRDTSTSQRSGSRPTTSRTNVGRSRSRCDGTPSSRARVRARSPSVAPVLAASAS